MGIIELKDLHKVYNENKPNAFEALRGINLSVREGEAAAIMGISGSGKSTLLHIIGCLDKPTSGECTIGGKDMNALSARDAASMRGGTIGFVLQEYGLLFNENVFDNIKLPLLFGDKYAYRVIKARVREVAETLNIADLLKKKVRELSGGQKQRVAIARAIANDPDVILADEPTGALDSKTAEDIMKVLLEINARGKTLITVTHDDAVAKKFGRVIRIADGLIESDSRENAAAQ